VIIMTALRQKEAEAELNGFGQELAQLVGDGADRRFV
jgi:hypothetical protein